MSEEKKVGHPLGAVPGMVVAGVFSYVAVERYLAQPDNVGFMLAAACAALFVAYATEAAFRFKARKDEAYGYCGKLFRYVVAFVFLGAGFYCAFRNFLDGYGLLSAAVAMALGVGAFAGLREIWRLVKNPKAYQQILDEKEAERAKRENEEPLGFDPETGEVFDYKSLKPRGRRSNALTNWESNLKTVWTGSQKVEFSYLNKKGQETRRNVIISAVERGYGGRLYFRGYCMLRGENRTFELSRIQSKILLENGKRYHVDEFLLNVLGVSVVDMASGGRY